MGTLRLDGWDAGIARMQAKVYQGALDTATQVHTAAVERAPVRKAFKSNRKATKHDVADFSQKIRGGSFTGADIQEAAGLLAVNLNPTQAAGLLAAVNTGKAQSNTRGTLGPNHLSWRRNRRSRITGRDLREITPGRTIGGRATRGGTFNRGRLRRQGITLLGRASREAARGVGVIRSGGRRQYGGYLKKHIVIIQPADAGNRMVFTVRSEAPYSRYVEFPTSRTAAQPFMLPALKGVRNRLASNIRRVRG